MVDYHDTPARTQVPGKNKTEREKKTQKSSIEYKLRRGIIPSYSTDTHTLVYLWHDAAPLFIYKRLYNII